MAMMGVLAMGAIALVIIILMIIGALMLIVSLTLWILCVIEKIRKGRCGRAKFVVATVLTATGFVMFAPCVWILLFAA